jgi:hypothetical protein
MIHKHDCMLASRYVNLHARPLSTRNVFDIVSLSHFHHCHHSSPTHAAQSPIKRPRSPHREVHSESRHNSHMATGCLIYSLKARMARTLTGSRSLVDARTSSPVPPHPRVYWLAGWLWFCSSHLTLALAPVTAVVLSSALFTVSLCNYSHPHTQILDQE